MLTLFLIYGTVVVVMAIQFYYSLLKDGKQNDKELLVGYVLLAFSWPAFLAWMIIRIHTMLKGKS